MTEPIAIVGLSCRLPGGANGLDSFWELLARGGEAWSPVPPDRFNETAFHHPNADDPNGTSNHRGGHFIDGDVRDFDHSFFHLSPPVAAAMDPQQRILLELAYEAFESAGWPREACVGSRTAVYAAIFSIDYERSLFKDVLDVPVYQVAGTGPAILANRISHVFDLRGPSLTLDTGCSGGMVGLHLACQSLRNGESDAALVASANLQLMPDHYIGMSNQHMASSTGKCYPFDVRGEGYGRGEGFVTLVLKRLSDAIRDRDPIRSIIRNTAVNQDGYTASGITHPNRVAQADLIRETYSRVGLRPQDAMYIEAHGTGTAAGDKEELAAIAEVFVGSGRSHPLYVGSNKGSIGHTESTSGLASLLKALLILEREVIPPVAGFANPKPDLPLDHICIPTGQLPWPHITGLTPRVSINSFGYGGANAHAIVERAPQTRESSSDGHDGVTAPCHRLFTLSANSQASLKNTLETHASWIEQHPEVPLADISHTLCHGRSALPWRWSCVSDSSSSLAHGLRQGRNTLPGKPAASKREITFVFTGQGAQWAGMGRELLLASTPSPVFRASIRASRDVLRELGAAWDLEAELLRAESGGAGGSSSSSSDINKAELAQPATTALQIALVETLRAQGVRPAAVVGHSSGEIAAAYAAGRLSRRTALRVAYHRGFMAAASKERGLPRGAMASVGLGEADTAPLLQGLARGKAVIACVNSPSSVTVSGDADAVSEVMERIAARGDGTFCRKLLVDTAYHSHHMRSVADEYLERLGELELIEQILPTSDGERGKNDVSWVSSVTGQPAPLSCKASYWVDNLVSPVRFLDAIQMTARSHHERNGGHALFLEVGPHSSLGGPIRQCLAAPTMPKIDFEYLSALQRGVHAVSSVLVLAGRLFERGVKMNWDEVSALAPGFDTAAMRPDLPSYSWDHTVQHWYESRLSREYRMRREPYHHLLGVRMIESSPFEPRWRHMVSLATLPWLADHVIDGLFIFPGAGYVCMTTEAMVQLAREQHPEQELETLLFREVSFLRGLVVPDAPQRMEVQLCLKRQPGASPLSFSFSVTALSDGKWNQYCTGFVEAVMADKTAGTEAKLPIPFSIPVWSDGTSFVPEQLYAEAAIEGNTYGPLFRCLRSLDMSADASESTAVVEVPNIQAVMPAQHQAPHILHPSTFDSMFHIGIPMIRKRHGPGSIMPVHIGELLISAKAPELSKPGSKLSILAKLTSSQFRATHTDMTVTAGTYPVMSATGIECRSLAAHTQGADDGICYELSWRPDLDFLRSSDLPANPTLADLVHHICFKTANLSVIELGAGHGDLALTFLTAVSVYGGTLATYDFVDTMPKLFDEARKRIIGHPVSYRTLEAEESLESQGFAAHMHDVVIVSDAGYLVHASTLLKKGGVVVLVLKPGMADTWQAALGEACPALEIQLKFTDAINDSLVVVARHTETQPLTFPPNLRILTHSARDVTPPWAKELEAGLREKGAQVRLETLSVSSLQNDADADTGVVVLDDLAQSIFSDERCFKTATALLRQNRQILWLSLDSHPSMNQITGVGRTAHAENDDLRLTTVQIDPNVLQSGRLVNLVSSWLRNADDRGDVLHHEREYRVREDAAVLVPRLHRSDELNRALNAPEQVDCVDIKSSHFVDAGEPLILNLKESPTSSSVVFAEGQVVDLADDRIEIDTQAFVLPKLDDPMAFSPGEYAGVVRCVGKSVKGVVPGDSVVALSLDGIVGHSRPQIPSSCVSRKPDGLPPTLGAALLLPALAAVYSLHQLAHLPAAGGVLLLHGALSDVGRATVAAARSCGTNVIATAAHDQDALEISQRLGIQAENIIIYSPSLLRPRHSSKLRVDAIVHAGKDHLPDLALSCLKPFGHVVVHSASPVEATTRLSRNATLHFCHMSDLLHEYPDDVVGLIPQAAAVLGQIPVQGLDLAIHNVSQVGEALRLLKLGVYNKTVLQASSDSLVRVSSQPRAERINSWATADASYVVAGGMGDLGRRLLLLMARRGARHLVTLSRRTVSPNDFRTMQEQLELIRPGCRLHCLICDVTSESSVRDAATALTSSGVPPVRGVIQSAAFLQDRTLETMTFEDFLSATHPKIEGTLTLEKVFSSPKLDFFLMLSSAVCITGASGQANYNAGNAVQDAMAHARGPGFLSLNIGWIEDAIHTSADKSRLQGLYRNGLRPIQPQELLRYFDYLLGAASSHLGLRQAVIGFDATSLSHASARNSTIQSALFCHVRNSALAGETSSATRGAQSFEEVVESGDSNAVVDFITAAIVNQLTKLISVDASQVNERDGSILDIGLDSLVAIELRNWITREFDAPLQSSEIMIDQPIRDLAQRVASRSRKVLSASSTESNSDTVETNGISAPQPSLGKTEKSQSATLYAKNTPQKLPRLPVPPLEDTLKRLEESRRALDTEEDRVQTTHDVREFLKEDGPALIQQVRDADLNDIADDYDRQFWLERRKPLHETFQFVFIHPVDAPTHSQARRAAILTVATMNFSRHLADGEVTPDTLQGEALSAEGLNWLFYANRRPCTGTDIMQRHATNNTVAVLRRGHVFQLTLPDASQPLDLPAVQAAFEEILQGSDEPGLSVCSLTADERDSWALIRQELESTVDNATAFKCIDEAAFLICLDDESPTNAGERFTQFLLNGKDRPLSNRWLDKTLQLIVTPNGLSAEMYQHAKLDGVDALPLHNHLCRALASQVQGESIETAVATAYPVREHTWAVRPAITRRIGDIQDLCRHTYGALDYRTVDIASLGAAALRRRRAAPNATANVALLLALYLIDGDARPAWEAISLGTFARGRVEWVQTFSAEALAFVEAVAASARATNGGRGAARTRARGLLRDAAASHARTVANAGRGRGILGPLYALRGVAQRGLGPRGEVPAFFRSRAWDATRRGGRGQDIRVGFIRLDDEEAGAAADAGEGGGASHGDEGGFIVPGERGVYIHCNVKETYARFTVSGKPAYAAKLCDTLGQAATIVADIVGDEE